MRVSIAAAWSSISPSRVDLRSLIRLIGLLADSRDLGLGPLADGGDIVVGLLAQLGGLGSAESEWIALDVGLSVGS